MLDKITALGRVNFPKMNAKISILLSFLFVLQLKARAGGSNEFQPVDMSAFFKASYKTNGTNVQLVMEPNAAKEKIFGSVIKGVPMVPYTPPQPSIFMHLIPEGINGKQPLPFKAVVVESPEVREAIAVSNQVVHLLATHEYDQLDDLAAKYRSSKEFDANGHWKLDIIYNSLNLPSQSSEAEWESRLNKLQDWIKAKPESITARVALADNLVSYAWKARGNGYAYTVKDEDWQTFFHRATEAANVLVPAQNLIDQSPRYRLVQMRIGLAEQVYRSQFDWVFKEAVKHEPDYERYYVARADFLLPRWNGDAGEWENDLEKSADQIGGEKGDMLYSRVIWDMNLYFTNVFRENDLSWPRVDRGFQAIEKHFPDSLAAQSEHAYLAVLAGDKQIAQTHFNRTEGHVDLSVWRSKDQYLSFATYAYLAK